ncbi:unnamed protein product [Peniophora sp. CBMAI 1063]|nr:unnamed protein product [Peniophora sp. CBMAI 1063]
MYPNHNKKVPWTMTQIDKVVDILLRRGAFDNTLKDDRDDDETDNDETEKSDSDTSDSDESSDDDNGKKKKKNKTKKKKVRREASRQTPSARVAALQAERSADASDKVNRKSQRETESILEEMAALPRTDPKYAVLYWKASKRDESVKQFWKPPITDGEQQGNTNNRSKPARTFLTQSTPSSAPTQKDNPPHQAPGRRPWADRGQNTDPACYGCGDENHRMGDCPEITALLREGAVQYHQGRLIHANGQPIRRRGSERIATAVRRERTSIVGTGNPEGSSTVPTLRTNFVSIRLGSDPEISESDENSESEWSDGESRFVGLTTMHDEGDSDDESDVVVFEAQETEKMKKTKQPPSTTGHRTRSSTGTARRQPLKDPEQFQLSAQKRSGGRTAPRIPGETNKHPETDRAHKAKKHARLTAEEPTYIPYAEDLPVIDMDDDRNFIDDPEDLADEETVTQETVTRGQQAQMVEEGAQTQKSAQRAAEIRKEKAREAQDGGREVVRAKPRPRMTPISATADRAAAFNAWLKSNTSISVRDLLVLSDYSQAELAQLCKKRAFLDNVVPAHSSLSSRVNLARLAARGLTTTANASTRGELLEFDIICNGWQVRALLDTGSQLNLMAGNLVDKCITQAVDRQATINLEVANGGKTTLTGLIKDVPFILGTQIRTKASVYRIDDPVNYQLLLGRPWQRDHFINIEERTNGTYLVLRNTRDRISYEVLVRPVSRNTVYDNDNRMRVAAPSARSHLVQVSSDELSSGPAQHANANPVPACTSAQDEQSRCVREHASCAQHANAVLTVTAQDLRNNNDGPAPSGVDPSADQQPLEPSPTSRTAKGKFDEDLEGEDWWPRKRTLRIKARRGERFNFRNRNYSLLPVLQPTQPSASSSFDLTPRIPTYSAPPVNASLYPFKSETCTPPAQLYASQVDASGSYLTRPYVFRVNELVRSQYTLPAPPVDTTCSLFTSTPTSSLAEALSFKIHDPSQVEFRDSIDLVLQDFSEPSFRHHPQVPYPYHLRDRIRATMQATTPVHSTNMLSLSHWLSGTSAPAAAPNPDDEPVYRSGDPFDPSRGLAFAKRCTLGDEAPPPGLEAAYNNEITVFSPRSFIVSARRLTFTDDGDDKAVLEVVMVNPLITIQTDPGDLTSAAVWTGLAGPVHGIESPDILRSRFRVRGVFVAQIFMSEQHVRQNLLTEPHTDVSLDRVSSTQGELPHWLPPMIADDPALAVTPMNRDFDSVVALAQQALTYAPSTALAMLFHESRHIFSAEPPCTQNGIRALDLVLTKGEMCIVNGTHECGFDSEGGLGRLINTTPLETCVEHTLFSSYPECHGSAVT